MCLSACAPALVDRADGLSECRMYRFMIKVYTYLLKCIIDAHLYLSTLRDLQMERRMNG